MCLSAFVYFCFPAKKISWEELNRKAQSKDLYEMDAGIQHRPGKMNQSDENVYSTIK
jgi:hypothetical protein